MVIKTIIIKINNYKIGKYEININEDEQKIKK